jgi:PKD repeat protein
MKRILNFVRRRIYVGVILTAAFVAAGCGLSDPAAPSLTGPSEFGQSVTLTASPDQLPRDGSSQSVVTVFVRDAQSRPVANQRLAVGLSSAAALVSAVEVITDPTGRATFAMTAPPENAVVQNNEIVISVIPIGGNFDNAAARTVTIRLVGVSNTTLPVPAFATSPAAAEINQVITFDATTTTDEGTQCLDLCAYTWDFDDGSAGIGRIVTHTFTTARGFNVLLSVRDAAGNVVNLRRIVNVVTPAAPTVTLTVAPNPPIVNQLATFMVTATPAANHAVQRFEWNFGDGNTTTTTASTVTKTYAALGIYTVTVRAIDDLGSAGSASLQLNITTGVATGINATFFFSPTNPSTGQTVFFNANESTPSNGATITEYRWDWGDGTETVTTSPTTGKVFGIVKSYVVQLTITDSQGRISRTRQNISVGL